MALFKVFLPLLCLVCRVAWSANGTCSSSRSAGECTAEFETMSVELLQTSADLRRTHSKLGQPARIKASESPPSALYEAREESALERQKHRVEGSALWIPLAMWTSLLDDPSSHWLLIIGGVSFVVTLGILQLGFLCQQPGDRAETVVAACNSVGFLGIFMFSGVILDSYDLAHRIGKDAAFSGMFIGVFMFASLFGSIVMWWLLRSHKALWRRHSRTVLVATLLLYIMGLAVYWLCTFLVEQPLTAALHLPWPLKTINPRDVRAVLPSALIASRVISGCGYGLLAMFVDVFFIFLTDSDARPRQMARVQFARMMGIGLGPLAAAGLWAFVGSNLAAVPSFVLGLSFAMLVHVYLCFPSLEDFQFFASVTSGESSPKLTSASTAESNSFSAGDRKKRQQIIGVCLFMGLLRGYIIAGLEAALAMILEVTYDWSVKDTGFCIGCIFLCCIPLKMFYETFGSSLAPTIWMRHMSWLSVVGALIAVVGLPFADATAVIIAAVIIFPTVFLADGLSRGIMYQHLLPEGELFADASYAGIYTQFMTNGLGRFLGPWFARLFLDSGGPSLYLKIQVVLVFTFTALAELFLIGSDRPSVDKSPKAKESDEALNAEPVPLKESLAPSDQHPSAASTKQACSDKALSSSIAIKTAKSGSTADDEDLKFRKAVWSVSKGPAVETGNERKLMYYKYFKQASVGNVQGSQPWAVQVESRFKWDAWNSVKGMSKEEARRKYVETFTEDNPKWEQWYEDEKPTGDHLPDV